MKVLLINGSPRVGGNTSIALGEMEKIFQQEGIQVETVQVGNKAIRGCVACLSCMEKGKCVFDDLVNETAPKFAEADGLVIASPVYYASANGTLISFIDRLFYSTPFDKTMKVGAAVAVARRGGRLRHLRRAEQVLCHFRHAHCHRPVLERCLWPGKGRGRPRRGGHADHAHLGPEHGFPDEEHRPGQGAVRRAAARTLPAHQFHPLKKAFSRITPPLGVHTTAKGGVFL